MPSYCLVCPICSERKEIVRPMSESNDLVFCDSGHLMGRDYAAEHSSVRGDFNDPIISESMAFDAIDLAEHRRRFPNIDVQVDHARSARPIFHSMSEKRAYLKARGWIDQNSFV